ncbi:MAG: hypothetical protein K0U41_00690 [Gammaproteobacteria bacterium]|nr:hypothetical protein [Gammaproteobacteria bacterium]
MPNFMYPILGFLVVVIFVAALGIDKANAEPKQQDETNRTEQQLMERPSGKVYLLCYLSVINTETGRTILLCEPLTGRDI